MYPTTPVVFAACAFLLIFTANAQPSGLISQFPGVSQMMTLFTEGAFAHQIVSKTCANENEFKIPKACRKELKNIPSMLEAVMTLDFESIDVPKMCDACDMDLVISHLDHIREQYKPADRDLSCGGSVVEELGRGSIYDTVTVFLKSACVKNEEDSYCFAADVFPAAMQSTGLMEAMQNSDIDVSNLNPATLSGLMTNINFGEICGGLKDGGCCSGMAIDMMKAMTELTCLDTPIISSAIGMTTAFCPQTPETCSGFKMPDYEKPKECPSGGFQGLLSAISDTTPFKDTKYNECVTDGCPKNDCELFLCNPSSMAGK